MIQDDSQSVSVLWYSSLFSHCLSFQIIYIQISTIFREMSRYDLVVYGATGFTGAYIVENIVTSKHFEGISFAVAGRNENKLRKVLDDISVKTGAYFMAVTNASRALTGIFSN